jgi:hypothetical protein
MTLHVSRREAKTAIRQMILENTNNKTLAEIETMTLDEHEISQFLIDQELAGMKFSDD